MTPSNCLRAKGQNDHGRFKYGRIPAVSNKSTFTGILWNLASQGLEYGSICESVPVIN